jgi:cobalt-zinc-cadmium efflux system membrane fusion protein
MLKMGKQNLTVLVALAIGLAGGAAGMNYYWRIRNDPGPAAPHRAKISYVRDTCCPTEGGEDGHAETGSDPHEHDNHEERAAEHGPESEHAEHGCIRLTDEAIRRFGIQLDTARGGTIEQRLVLPGEIVLNTDRVAHIVPRVAGMVREVTRSVGDRVEAGDLLAVLESRELAEAKAADLTAEARLKLAESSLKRLEGLRQQQLVPERQYLEAQQGVEEAQIAHRETMAKLHALGMTHEQLEAMSEADQSILARYEVRAPFAGTLIERHATLGEVHDSSSTLFVLADLSTVWADITVYAQDAHRLNMGSKLRVVHSANGSEVSTAEGEVFYVSPMLREATRTGLARALITNEDRRWRPGMFVSAEVLVGSEAGEVVVPQDAVQKVGGETVVFVADEDGFEKRPVVTGKSDQSSVHIVSGLTPGEEFVSKAAFILKAELSKGTGGHEH